MSTAYASLPILLFLFAGTAVILIPQASAGLVGLPGPPPPNCEDTPQCPTPLCADPVTPPGQCCPSCANSKCKFEGCVQFHPNSRFAPVRWLPEPCKICFCLGGETTCGVIGCPGFVGPDPCFGRPITPVGSSPSVCCPRCDFGVPETSCRAVPATRKPFTIQQGTSSCSGEITEHECDKIGYRRAGKLFRCVAVKRNRHVSVSGSGCDPFTMVVHRDVSRCRAIQDNTLTEAEGCDLLVTPRPPVGSPGRQ